MSKIVSFPPPSSVRHDAAEPTFKVANNVHGPCETAGDPATLIGLAMSFARQGPLFCGVVPQLIIDRLETHALYGNPACRMVLNWLGKHSTVTTAEKAVIADDDTPECQIAPRPTRRRSQHDRVMSALVAAPPLDPAETPRAFRRKRREPLAEIVSATKVVSDEETSHG